MENDQLTIRSFQHMVDTWIRSTGKGYFSPLTNMAILAEETGEVARIMARRFGDQSSKPTDSASLDDLAEELADVIRVTVAIANQNGIDLTQALIRKDNIIRTRDAHRHDR